MCWICALKTKATSIFSTEWKRMTQKKKKNWLRSCCWETFLWHAAARRALLLSETVCSTVLVLGMWHFGERSVCI